MTRAASPPARGMPLAMMGLVLAAWIGGRTLLWESPFPAPAALLPPTLALGAPAAAAAARPVSAQPAGSQGAMRASGALAGRGARSGGTLALLGSGLAAGLDPRLAAAHHSLLHEAMGRALVPASGLRVLRAADPAAPAEPPLFLPQRSARTGGRLSLDAWAFWRQGSDAAPVSQGRVPIYGASQAGAVLNYRLAPASRRDPRLYARAYRALVRRGESELALGASLRPVPRVPLRVAGEVRLTDGAFRTEARPSAFAVTEIAPIALPLGTRLETYAQGGWVGGTDDTLFADGQASLTREVGAVAAATDNMVRLSLGAAAWGGAQEGVHRVDLGPTMRFDVTLGAVPARVSVDWRERVEGAAGPDSGVAVTLSTGF